MAKTARDVMSGDCECVGENETVLDAAKKMSPSSTSACCRSAAQTTG